MYTKLHKLQQKHTQISQEELLITLLGLTSTKKSLLEALLQVAAKYRRNVFINQSTLARRLGITRVHTNRCISEMQRAGILYREQRKSLKKDEWRSCWYQFSPHFFNVSFRKKLAPFLAQMCTLYLALLMPGLYADVTRRSSKELYKESKTYNNTSTSYLERDIQTKRDSQSIPESISCGRVRVETTTDNSKKRTSMFSTLTPEQLTQLASFEKKDIDLVITKMKKTGKHFQDPFAYLLRSLHNLKYEQASTTTVKNDRYGMGVSKPNHHSPALKFDTKRGYEWEQSRAKEHRNKQSFTYIHTDLWRFCTINPSTPEQLEKAAEDIPMDVWEKAVPYVLDQFKVYAPRPIRERYWNMFDTPVANLLKDVSDRFTDDEWILMKYSLNQFAITELPHHLLDEWLNDITTKIHKGEEVNAKEKQLLRLLLSEQNKRNHV